MVRKRNIIATLALAVMLSSTGCTHTKGGGAHGFGGILGNSDGVYGYVNTRSTKNTSSMCVNGLLRAWEHAGCNQFGYEKLAEGYYKHWCADENSGNSVDPIRSWDYFVIMWNQTLHQYSRGMPEGTSPVCGDPYTIIIASERD
jgi:hypothetical protein